MTEQVDQKTIEEAVRNALNPLVRYDYANDRQVAVTQDDVAKWEQSMRAVNELNGAIRRYTEAMEAIWKK